MSSFSTFLVYGFDARVVRLSLLALFGCDTRFSCIIIFVIFCNVLNDSFAIWSTRESTQLWDRWPKCWRRGFSPLAEFHASAIKIINLRINAKRSQLARWQGGLKETLLDLPGSENFRRPSVHQHLPQAWLILPGARSGAPHGVRVRRLIFSKG